MAYETSLLFSLLQQKRAERMAQEKQNALAADNEVNTALAKEDARRQETENARTQWAGQQAMLSGEAGVPVQDANWTAGMKEAAGLMQLAQLAKRKQAEQARMQQVEDMGFKAGNEYDLRAMQKQEDLEREKIRQEGAYARAELMQNRKAGLHPTTGRPLKPSESNFYLMKANNLGTNVVNPAYGSIDPIVAGERRRAANLSLVLIDLAEQSQTDPQGAAARYAKLQAMYPEYLMPQVKVSQTSKYQGQ